MSYDTKPAHTPEPWQPEDLPRKRLGISGDGGGGHVAEAYSDDDRRRIIACVNACAGIPDPAAALKQARQALLLGSMVVVNYAPDKRPFLDTIAAALRALGG
jgi:hypothetical protein